MDKFMQSKNLSYGTRAERKESMCKIFSEEEKKMKELEEESKVLNRSHKAKFDK